MLPLFGLRLAWRLALAPWRCSFYYIRCMQAQVLSITSRVRKTLLGSSDDIGWLQHTPGMAPVEDGTVRFLELLEKIRDMNSYNWVHNFFGTCYPSVMLIPQEWRAQPPELICLFINSRPFQ